MAELQPPSQTNHPTPAASPSGPGVRGEQRRDVPYHWPRGPEAPSSPAERRLHGALIALVVVVSLAALALLWYMIAKSTRAF
jgi:hypothetical protein